MRDPTSVEPGAAGQVPRPRWGVLYGLALSGLAAIVVADTAAVVSHRSTVESGLVLVTLAAVGLWVRRSRVALDRQEWCDCAADTITARVIPSRRLERRGAPVPRPTVPWMFEPVPANEDDEVSAVGSEAY